MGTNNTYALEQAELCDVAELRQWTLNTLRSPRYDATRFMLVAETHGGGGWLDSKEGRFRVSSELFSRLDRRWPRSARSGGKSHLSSAGVLDLLGHSAVLKTEAARLRRLDVERHGRVNALEEVSDRAHASAAGYHAAKARADANHPPYHCCIDCGAPLCRQAREIRYQAWDRSREWQHQPHPALDGLTPYDAAAENDEGLARALFALQAITTGAGAASYDA
jgi:hypothetical protein